MSGQRLMVCGHWSGWYHHEKGIVLNGRKREMFEFGPGCMACFQGAPKEMYVIRSMRKHNDAFELYDPRAIVTQPEQPERVEPNAMTDTPVDSITEESNDDTLLS